MLEVSSRVASSRPVVRTGLYGLGCLGARIWGCVHGCAVVAVRLAFALLGNHLQQFIITAIRYRRGGSAKRAGSVQAIVQGKGVSGGSSDVIHDRFRCCPARK